MELTQKKKITSCVWDVGWAEEDYKLCVGCGVELAQKNDLTMVR